MKFSIRLLGSLGCLISLGCATQASRHVTDGARFHDSVTRVISDAPASMSPPAGDLPVVDPVYMRTQADYHFAMGDAQSLDGNTDQAIEEFKLALVYDPSSATLHLRLAAEYVKKGMVTEAMEQTQQSIKLDSNNSDAHMLLAGLYSAMKSYDKAIDEYREVVRIDPDDSEAAVYIGALLAEEKKYDQAVAHFHKLAADPNNKKNAHLAYYYIGRLYQDQNAKEKADKAFRKSIELKPDFVEATLSLGELMLTMNRRAETIKLFKNYQDKYGPNQQVADQLGRMYMEDENYDAAYEQFEILEGSDPDNLNVKVKMALILIEQKHYKEAIVKLDEILVRAPNSDKIRFYLGAVHEELQEYPQAISQFSQIPPDSSFYAEAVVHAAYLYKLTNNYKQAIATIQTGISVKNDVPQFYALYASFLDDTKDYHRAIDMLKGALAKFPDNTQLRFFLGSMYDRVHDLDNVIAEMKKVIELDEQHVQALNYLAYTYAENNRDLNEAERLARKALEFQPNDGYILDTLGWVLYKENRTTEAVRVLEIAFQKQSNEGVIAEHLGDAYYKSQLPEKARAMYKKAVEIEKDADQIQKLKSKIVAIDNQSNPLARAAREPASVK